MEKLKIVYVDDDINNLNHFKKMLSEHFEIDTFLRAKDFLTSLEEKDYDCYVFDFYIPGHDGIALLEQVRAHPEKKMAPIFIITSNSTDEIRISSYKNGAADFMDRLIQKEEMIARINGRITQYKEFSSILKIGNLKINLGTMKCELSSKSIEMTLLEYKVLTGLVKKHPVKMKKTEIVELIWGKSTLSDNNLNTHLYNLRRKINDWDYEISNHRTEGFWLSKK